MLVEKLNVVIAPAGGAFGSAISIPLLANGHEVTLAFRSEEKAQRFRESRRLEEERLKGFVFPEDIRVTSDTAEAVRNADLVVLATPARFIETYYPVNIQPFRKPDTNVLIPSKGLVKIENKYLRPSEVVSYFDPSATRHRVVLSGPNFAAEIARGLPFVTVIAAEDPRLAEEMVDIFSLTPQYRIYPSEDVAGVELGGAFKNVIAIAAGISDGLEYGENARAALIKRGALEIVRLGVALGGQKDTLTGISGDADLWMTCVSSQSRNHQFGVQIGQGKTPAELLRSGQTVEGYYTVKVAWEFVREYDVKAPITKLVYCVLHKGMEVAEAVKQLQEREPVYEDGRPLARSLSR